MHKNYNQLSLNERRTIYKLLEVGKSKIKRFYVFLYAIVPKRNDERTPSLQ